MTADAGAATVRLRINGTSVECAVQPRHTLADTLRERLRLTGVHLGCEHGVCGMCTVLVDGRAVRACLLFTIQLDGADIITVEALGDPSDLHPLQEAFRAHHALQCGFCTPAFLLSAYELLRHNPTLAGADLATELSGVLCRCTGYQGILSAVREVAARHPDGLPPPKAVREDRALAVRAMFPGSAPHHQSNDPQTRTRVDAMEVPAMHYRPLGRTGLDVSCLGYGAGAVGGLMVRGAAEDQERSVARALDAGISYFDTAPLYGEGESERNLGRVLRALRASPLVGTKVRLAPEQADDLGGAVAASLEASLRRLGRDDVDLFQLHNPVTAAGRDGALTPRQVLDGVLPAMARLRDSGKARVLGVTAIGESAALRELIDAAAFDVVQLPHNLLDPRPVAASDGQSYATLLEACEASGTGVLGIRILAAGALSGQAARHPVAMQDVAPIGSGPDLAADLVAAQRFAPLVEEGHASSLAEAAIRYVLASAAVSTALIGTASLAQLDTAIAAAEKGPLPAEAMRRAAALRG
ncbi:MAG: aldo/keto reductase [Carbonactinosporaceae bacterium]